MDQHHISGAATAKPIFTFGSSPRSSLLYFTKTYEEHVRLLLCGMFTNSFLFLLKGKTNVTPVDRRAVICIPLLFLSSQPSFSQSSPFTHPVSGAPRWPREARPKPDLPLLLTPRLNDQLAPGLRPPEDTPRDHRGVWRLPGRPPGLVGLHGPVWLFRPGAGAGSRGGVLYVSLPGYYPPEGPDELQRERASSCHRNR